MIQFELTAASNESQKPSQVRGSPVKLGRFNLGSQLTGCSLLCIGSLGTLNSMVDTLRRWVA